MLEDQHDKEMMRNQMFAIILMMFLVWGWFTFFMPQQPRPAQAPPGESGAPASFAEAGEHTQDGLLRAPLASEADPDRPEWPMLPPVPTQFDPADDEVLISDGALVLTFTRIGGRLKRAEVLLDGTKEGSIQLVPQFPGALDTESIYPLGLRFSDVRIGDELDFRRFEFSLDRSGKAVTFTLELPGAALVTKTFRLIDGSRMLDIDIEYKNLESAPRALGLDVIPAYILNWGPGLVVEGEGSYFPPELVWRKELEGYVFKPDDLPQTDGLPEDKRIPRLEWIGYKSKYFIAALKPDGDEALADGWAIGRKESFRYGLYTPQFEVRPGEIHTSGFQLYIGPMHIGDLREAWPTLHTALRFFKPKGFLGKTVNDGMDWFAKTLLRNLNWWYGYFPNYGVAIILLTVLVRMVMFPLTLKSMRSMKKMQTLQPEMEALREKHKDDQQALSQATMQMYKERGINPLAGCFPMLLQMPVFIALYRMLWNAFELRGASFLWIDDLSQPDRLFHMPFLKGLPIVGGALEYFNILPILVALAMVVSMKLTPTSGPSQNPQQKMIMTIMPIMFGFISYPFAAGLNLYVLTSTVLGILQSRLIRSTDIAGPKLVEATATPEGNGPIKKAKAVQPKQKKKPSKDGRRKKPQHFYDRAQQRKREMAKAGRKKGRRK